MFSVGFNGLDKNMSYNKATHNSPLNLIAQVRNTCPIKSYEWKKLEQCRKCNS